MNIFVQDKQRIRSFTYGLSENQANSFEVVIAKKLSQLLGTKWEQIELGEYNRYIPEWFYLYGISAHVHGMYHIEFYHKIRSILAADSVGEISFLSGIFGDVWAGNVAYQEVNSYKDLRTLGYTHGMDLYDISELIDTDEIEAKKFYSEYRDKINDYKWQPIITIRAKIILISYLMNLPDYFGIPSWTPYLNFEIVKSMLSIPQNRRTGRRWQKDFFIKNGVDLDQYISQSDPSNMLNAISICCHMPELLNVDLLSTYIDKNQINLINSSLLNFSRHKLLGDTKATQIAWAHYIRYLVLKALELLLREKMSAETIAQSELLNKHGEDLFEKGDTEGALHAFEMAIEKDPNSAISHSNLGVLFWQKREIDKAMEYLNKALKIDQNNREIVLNSGEVLKSQDKTDDAKRLYSSYLQNNPNDEEITRLLLNLGVKSKTHDKEKPNYYSKEYFDYQKTIGSFGGIANNFKFSEFICDSDNVVDFGCGGGYLLSNIQCRNKIGIEINKVARAEAVKNGIDVRESVSELSDEFADVIISNYALEHVSSPMEILKGLYPKLKPNGRIIFVVPHQGPHEDYTPDDINKHLFTWNPLTLGNLFAEAGYKVIKVEAIQHQWPPNYLELYNTVGEEKFHKKCQEYAIENNNYQIRIIATTNGSNEYHSCNKGLGSVPQKCTVKVSKCRKEINDIPVILIAYKRPLHTEQVLNALRQHNIQRLYIFSDGPKTHEDAVAVNETRQLFKKIDWTTPIVVEREGNIGLAKSIVSAVDNVFQTHECLILLEDDCVPQKYFFEFMSECLNRYEDNEKIFGISGHTVSIPDAVFQNYEYDLYFSPRIGSWGWATWKSAWKYFEPDLGKALIKAKENNIDLSQGGSDVPIMIDNMLKGHLKDVWTLNWVISVYLNKGYYIYPKVSHIINTGCDGSGMHSNKTSYYDSQISDIKPVLYPDEIFISERVYKHFRVYFDIPGQKTINEVNRFSTSCPHCKEILYVDRKGRWQCPCCKNDFMV